MRSNPSRRQPIMRVTVRVVPFALVALFACGYAISAVDSPEGPPPCGQDGICNVAACSNDPDCPKDLPSGGGGNTSPAPPNAHASRPGDVDDCTSTEDSEITEAIDWGAENWS